MITAEMPMAASVPFRAPASTRSILPAPIFCPAKVVIAVPREKAGIITKPSMRMTMTFAAMNISPKLLVSDWTTIMDMEKIACVTPEGRPRRISVRKYLPPGIRWRRRSSKMSFIRRILTRASTAETSWAITVAQATPATPIPSFATKT